MYIFLTRAVYSYKTLKAIQYYIIIMPFRLYIYEHQWSLLNTTVKLYNNFT